MMFLAMCIMLRVANKSFRAVVHWSGVLDQIMVPGLVTAQFELFLYCQRYTLMKGLIIDLCCWCSFYAGAPNHGNWTAGSQAGSLCLGSLCPDYHAYGGFRDVCLESLSVVSSCLALQVVHFRTLIHIERRCVRQRSSLIMCDWSSRMVNLRLGFVGIRLKKILPELDYIHYIHLILYSL